MLEITQKYCHFNMFIFVRDNVFMCTDCPYIMSYILNVLNATFVNFYHISRNKLHVKEIKCAFDLILY